jgi:hypothetical protein
MKKVGEIMFGTAKEYIERIRKPEHEMISFQFQGKFKRLDIEDFIREYGLMKVGINGDFYTNEGYIMLGSFIKWTF